MKKVYLSPSSWASSALFKSKKWGRKWSLGKAGISFIYFPWHAFTFFWDIKTVGSCRINRLLFADDSVLLASSQQDFQHARNLLSAACDQAGMKISTQNEELCLSRNPRQCALQMSGNTLQNMRKFKCLEVVFTSDRRWNKEIDTRICKESAVYQKTQSFIALWWQSGNFQTPQSCKFLNRSLFRSSRVVMKIG